MRYKLSELKKGREYTQGDIVTNSAGNIILIIGYPNIGQFYSGVILNKALPDYCTVLLKDLITELYKGSITLENDEL